MTYICYPNYTSLHRPNNIKFDPNSNHGKRKPPSQAMKCTSLTFQKKVESAEGTESQQLPTQKHSSQLHKIQNISARSKKGNNQ